VESKTERDLEMLSQVAGVAEDSRRRRRKQ
jgi:hypothetical protein